MKLGVPGLVRDDLAAERQGQRRVRAGLDPEVRVRLRGGRREARVDDHEPRARLERVEDEVDVGDPRLDRVRADEQQEPAVRPVLRLVLGVLDAERDRHPHRQVAVEVEARAVGHARAARRPGSWRPSGCSRSPGTWPKTWIESQPHVSPIRLQVAGDPVEDLLPGGLAELARAALAGPDQRLQDPVRAVDRG